MNSQICIEDCILNFIVFIYILYIFLRGSLFRFKGHEPRNIFSYCVNLKIIAI